MIAKNPLKGYHLLVVLLLRHRTPKPYTKSLKSPMKWLEMASKCSHPTSVDYMRLTALPRRFIKRAPDGSTVEFKMVEVNKKRHRGGAKRNKNKKSKSSLVIGKSFDV